MNREMTVGPYRLTLFLPDGPYSGAVYIPSHGRPEEVARLISPLRAALVFIEGFDWNRDLSPWPAEPVFGTEAFGGQADAFLETLTRELIPAAEHEMPEDICWRGIAGYSLAGLFAVYAAYRSNLFPARLRLRALCGSTAGRNTQRAIRSPEASLMPFSRSAQRRKRREIPACSRSRNAPAKCMSCLSGAA